MPAQPLQLSTPITKEIPDSVTQVLSNVSGVQIKMLLFKLRYIGSATEVKLGDANSQEITFINEGDVFPLSAGKCEYIRGEQFYAISDAVLPDDLPILEVVFLTT